MKYGLFMVAAFAVLASAIGLYLQSGDGGSVAEAGGDHAQVVVRDASNAPVAVVKLTQEDGEVLVRVTANGLAPGFHGFHIHSVGMCVAPFTSAGGHLNLAGVGHPGHSGDMPVLLINGDGTGEARFKTDRFGIGDLFDADGSAIIIHGGADNYANIPTRYSASGPDAATLGTGDAGSRVGCGIIEGS